MSFQYDFPSELLLAIFGNVEDLLTLAATCRRFNHLSLQTFFSRHNFNPNCKTIILQPSDGSLEIIPALAMSLALRRTSVEHLSFDPGRIYDTRRLLHQIHALTGYIMNLTTTNRVTLRVTMPNVSFQGDWGPVYVALLDTVIEKSCSNLHVETYYSSGYDRQSDHSLSISRPRNWFRIPGKLSEAVNKSNGEVKYLKDCFIQTFPTFLRPFYLRILQANAPILTGLAFKHIFGSMTAIDWGFLLANLHLPVLKRFAISFGVIPQGALIKFLSKHSHLTNFEYHHIKYTIEPKGAPRRLKGVFKHLEQLTTTPEHILRFLPTLDRMPRLASVTIIKDEHIDFSVVEQALSRFSSCVQKIELTLDISSVNSGLDPLPELAHFGSSFGREDGFRLRCVESIHICREYAAENVANVLVQLTAWLKLFPELKQLTLNSRKPSSRRLVVRNALPPFFERVKVACPTIELISLQGESEWTL